MENQFKKLKDQNKDLMYLNSILERNNQLQKEEIIYLKSCLGIDTNGSDDENYLTVE